jgi:hypothetical protein
LVHCALPNNARRPKMASSNILLFSVLDYPDDKEPHVRVLPRLLIPYLARPAWRVLTACLAISIACLTSPSTLKGQALSSITGTVTDATGGAGGGGRQPRLHRAGRQHRAAPR